jgi:hypothetical protein
MKPTPDIRPATREDARELFAPGSPAEALICRVDGEALEKLAGKSQGGA